VVHVVDLGFCKADLLEMHALPVDQSFLLDAPAVILLEGSTTKAVVVKECRRRRVTVPQRILVERSRRVHSNAPSVVVVGRRTRHESVVLEFEFYIEIGSL